MGGGILKENIEYLSYPAYIRFNRQTDKQLLKSIRSIEKELEKHKNKVISPMCYVSDWDKRNTYYRIGIVEKWKKEIKNFETEILIGKLIATERGIL